MLECGTTLMDGPSRSGNFVRKEHVVIEPCQPMPQPDRGNTLIGEWQFFFLHYPFIGWGQGFPQLSNKVFYCIRIGRIGGICSVLLSIPGECIVIASIGKPIPWQTLKEFHHFKRTGVLSRIWTEKADNQRQ
jgi:hypothetical protein